MNDKYKLQMLKTDLGITTTAYDERLSAYLTSAQELIVREGVTLRDTMEDTQIEIMYAAWLWRRRDSGKGMPRMLRWALNNRVFSEKMEGSDG